MTTINLDTITLTSGSHKSPDDGFCVMEAVSYIAGEPWSDHPKCVSPIIAEFMRSWNDSLPDDQRQILKPYIPKLIGTNTGKQDDETRVWLLTDWLARECAPGFLRLAGLTAEAELLEELAPLVDGSSAKVAQPALDRARKAGAAAGAAAWDAARAAARDAAWAAAWDAAGDAARAAAGDAARAAAWAAAWDAAWDAAGDAAWAAARDAARAAAGAAAWAAARAAARDGGSYHHQYNAAYTAAKPLVEQQLGPTVQALQASALLLLDRLIAVGTTDTQAA